MMNAKDISSRRFEKATFGYKTDEVDEFLREIAFDYEKLSMELEENEKKLDVLVEKVREYKRDEDALKDALLGAQRQGRLVVTEAREAADQIVAEAKEQAKNILSGTQGELEREKQALEHMQIEVSKFKSGLLSLYKNHLDLITALPEVEYDEEESAEYDESEVGEDDAAQEVQSEEQEETYSPDYAEDDYSEDDEYAQEAEESSHINDISFAKPSIKSNVESKFGTLKFGEHKQ